MSWWEENVTGEGALVALAITLIGVGLIVNTCTPSDPGHSCARACENGYGGFVTKGDIQDGRVTHIECGRRP